MDSVFLGTSETIGTSRVSPVTTCDNKPSWRPRFSKPSTNLFFTKISHSWMSILLEISMIACSSGAFSPCCMSRGGLKKTRRRARVGLLLVMGSCMLAM